MRNCWNRTPLRRGFILRSANRAGERKDLRQSEEIGDQENQEDEYRSADQRADAVAGRREAIDLAGELRCLGIAERRDAHLGFGHAHAQSFELGAHLGAIEQARDACAIGDGGRAAGGDHLGLRGVGHGHRAYGTDEQYGDQAAKLGDHVGLPIGGCLPVAGIFAGDAFASVRCRTQWHAAFMLPFTLLVLATALPTLARASDPQQRAIFVQKHPCPADGKTGGVCSGYVISHVVPLCSGGKDVPGNMRWQPVAETRAGARERHKLCHRAISRRPAPREASD